MSYFLIKGVPHLRQFHDVTDASIRNCTCAFVTFKVGGEFVSRCSLPPVEDFYRAVTIVQADMVNKGTITEKAFRVGPLHETLITIGRNYGVSSYKQEFRSLEPKNRLEEGPFSRKIYLQGIDKIKRNLRGDRPVMVSVCRNMDPKSTRHTVLLVGYQEGRGFFYHDSDGEEEKPRKEVFVADPVFQKCWRRMAIFFER